MLLQILHGELPLPLRAKVMKTFVEVWVGGCMETMVLVVLVLG